MPRRRSSVRATPHERTDFPPVELATRGKRSRRRALGRSGYIIALVAAVARPSEDDVNHAECEEREVLHADVPGPALQALEAFAGTRRYHSVQMDGNELEFQVTSPIAGDIELDVLGGEVVEMEKLISWRELSVESALRIARLCGGWMAPMNVDKIERSFRHPRTISEATAGSAVLEVECSLGEKRIEVHIAPNLQVLYIEQKDDGPGCQ